MNPKVINLTYGGTELQSSKIKPCKRHYYTSGDAEERRKGNYILGYQGKSLFKDPFPH